VRAAGFAVCSQAESLVQHLVSDMASEDIACPPGSNGPSAAALRTTVQKGFRPRMLHAVMYNLTGQRTHRLKSTSARCSATMQAKTAKAITTVRTVQLA
jgi:hypothetical protein